MADEDRTAIETEAKVFGWVPKEQFHGPEDQWRDAEEFVKRGKEFLPIANANNRKLVEKLDEANRQLVALKGTVTQQGQTMKDLLEHQAGEIRRQVEDKIKGLRADKLEAIEDGDHKLAAKLEDQIDETKTALEKAERAKTATPPPPAPSAPADVEPWVKAFSDANDSWLGKDEEKTGLFMGICEKLYKNTTLRGAALLEEGKKKMEARFAETPRAAKSEGGDGTWRGEGGGGSNSGSAFKDLPSEAQAYCKAQEKKFVGPKGSGKAFETEAAWHKHYAETFFAAQNSR